jgi:hypothetical protein
LDRLHIRVHLWWVYRWIRRLLVVTGARCPLTKPVVTAVELQATTEPHCSRGVQPGGICVYIGTSRADSRRSGVVLAPGRPQALPMPATALALYTLRYAPAASPQVPCGLGTSRQGLSSRRGAVRKSGPLRTHYTKRHPLDPTRWVGRGAYVGHALTALSSVGYVGRVFSRYLSIHGTKRSR